MASPTPSISEDQPLGALLGPELCAEVVLLVGKTTERMRAAIFDTFKATEKRSEGAFDKKPRKENPNLKTDTANVPLDEDAIMRRQRIERGLSTPQFQRFKTDALHHFDSWRDAVILRAGKEQQASSSSTEPPMLSRMDQASAAFPKQPVHTSGHAEAVLKYLFPPIETPLTSLSLETRTAILHSSLLLLLSLEHYTAYSRTLLLRLASSLEVPVASLNHSEAKIAHGLLEVAAAMNADAEAKAREESSRTARRWKIGIASVAGAALVGVTGGLAAPIVAAGIGGILGGIGLGGTLAAGILGSIAGSGVLVGGLFGAYGASLTGKMMESYTKEVSDFAFLPIRDDEGKSNNEKRANRRMRVTIGISGWLETAPEVVTPWRVIGPASEVFALRWELDALLELGSALESMVMTYGIGIRMQLFSLKYKGVDANITLVSIEILKRTVLASLWAALWPIGLLKLGRIVDNPFSIAKSRSEKAGEVLADALINKVQGERPVTLIGYSLGARVIFSCLISLAKRRAFGLVESVVFIGSAIPSDTPDWKIMRSVVTGRLVNVYSENDFILAFIYRYVTKPQFETAIVEPKLIGTRTSSIQDGIAGLQRIEDVAGVENFDVSKQVSGHLKYRYLIGDILRRIGWDDLQMKELRREQQMLQLMEEKEEKARKARVQKEGSSGMERQNRLEDLKEEARRSSSSSPMPVSSETHGMDLLDLSEPAAKLPPQPKSANKDLLGMEELKSSISPFKSSQSPAAHSPSQPFNSPPSPNQRTTPNQAPLFSTQSRDTDDDPLSTTDLESEAPIPTPEESDDEVEMLHLAPFPEDSVMDEVEPEPEMDREEKNKELHDYQTQIMLLEQHNKKRLLMARQEQDNNSKGESDRDGSIRQYNDRNYGGETSLLD